MATVMVPVLTALSDGLGMDLETLTWSVSKGTDIGGDCHPHRGLGQRHRRHAGRPRGAPHLLAAVL